MNNRFDDSLSSPLAGIVFLSMLLFLLGASALRGEERGREAIPDKLIVLTFDDGNKSDLTYVAHALTRLGFGATFFVTEALGFGGEGRLTWEDVRELDKLGFEVANHTISHPNLVKIPPQEVRRQIADFTRHCQENGREDRNLLFELRLASTEMSVKMGQQGAMRAGFPPGFQVFWGCKKGSVEGETRAATRQRNEGKPRRTSSRASLPESRRSQESGQVGTSSQKMESVESWIWRACSGESEASSWSSL